MKTQIAILLVEDHTLVRQALRLLIDVQPDMRVVGEASDPASALQQVERLQPDLVLMDITIPEPGGIRTTEVITTRWPQVRVLALTMHEDEAFVRSILTAGGMGYVLKRAADTELVAAIRSVHRGRHFVDPNLSGAILYEVLAQRSRPRRGTGALLSRRERETLVLVAEGYTNQQAADRLGVSAKTIETYRARLSVKLGLRSRHEIVHYAIETRLLSPQTFGD